MLSEKIEKYKNVLLITLSILVILYFGRVLFIPLSFSILISFLLYPICGWLEKRKVPRTFAVAISISLLVTIFLLLSALLFQQLASFSHDWGSLKSRLPEALIQINTLLNEIGISAELQKKWFDYFSGNSSTELFHFFNTLLYSSGLILVWLVIIPFFSALILLNRSTLLKVLYSFFLPETIETVHNVLQQIVTTFYNFIKGMIVVYIIVGVLNSLGLLLLGIPHAFLFGFIVSILTFIPYVGIIIGSLLPITVAWITYNSIWYPLGVVIIFTIVQYLEANLIFPLAVSSRLNISSLATLISIISGGILWGTAGMILFVPFIAIIKLIADNTKELKSLSILLGNK
jgi:predicted PurR-regulated permease PerM